MYDKSWLVLSKRPSSLATGRVEIPWGRRASFICLAQFCDYDENEAPPSGEDTVEMEKIGQRLGDAVAVYEDGSTQVFPIRRRFEVQSPATGRGHLSFNAMPHLTDGPRKLTGPLENALAWGGLQTAVWDRAYHAPILWVCALRNPAPERARKYLRFEAASIDRLFVCGLTLFHGPENPLRYDRLRLYRVTVPEPGEEEEGRSKVETDLRDVARTYVLSDFEPDVWVAAPDAGVISRIDPVRGTRYLYAEITACSQATLTLRDNKSGKEYQFDLEKVVPGHELEARPGGARVEVLEYDKVWLHGKIVDSAKDRPTPVRLAFRSKEGRYIPPYGHRTEINNGWFQDYGADVQMDVPFAYMDGTFQVELPMGEVLLEMRKGFEYAPIRKKLKIDPGQRELNLEISRLADFRSQGWVNADTHVHFLSPSTAVLEGQAEGLNLINLLATQWGDLFTNVGDLPHGPLTSRDGETHVGSERRVASTSLATWAC